MKFRANGVDYGAENIEVNSGKGPYFRGYGRWNLDLDMIEPGMYNGRSGMNFMKLLWVDYGITIRIRQ